MAEDRRNARRYIFLLILLILDLCKARSSGYLYSKHSKSFVSLRHGGDPRKLVPVLFVMRSKGKEMEIYISKDGRYLPIHGGMKKKYKVEMNSKGEVRIRDGKMCETIYGEFLRSEKCKDNPRQKFTWVPLKLFMKQGSGKKGKKPKIPGTKDLPRDKKGSKNRIVDDYLKSRCSKNKKLPICSLLSDGLSNKGKNNTNCDKIYSNLGALEALLSRNMPSVDGKVTKDLDVLMSRSGLDKKEKKRRRGPYGSGEDSESCECKNDCVINPKNGQCFYKMETNGNLVPLMRGGDCCKKSQKMLCDLENKLEKHLCELNFKNDFSFFSKFLDDNRLCD